MTLLGFNLNNSVVKLADVSVQPKEAVGPFIIATSNLPGSVVFAKDIGNAVISSVKVKVYDGFDFRLVKEALPQRVDTRFNDDLPRSTARFTAFEELSGISSSRPEILSVSEFKPLFAAGNAGFTPAGEFLDAQVKLMNLRQEAIVSLIKDLKADPELAAQLSTIENEFVTHVKKVKTQADFMVSLQSYVERLTNVLDLRDPNARADAASLVSQYYSRVFEDVAAAKATLPVTTYVDLLTQHGFGKGNALGFSNTKLFLQTLYEAKKMLRVGSDELASVDPSLTARDVDPISLNRRSFKDPHVELGKVESFPTLSDVASQDIHSSDARLTSYLQILASGFSSLDQVFASANSEETSYALKARVLTREAAYSTTLADDAVVSLLAQYGYPVSADLGNQQLFDAVYGQLGSRVTDDRTSANANAVGSVASRVVDGAAVLTFETDYLEDDQGSIFTPGAAYYVASVARPTDDGFAVDRPAGLISRLGSVIDRYVDVVGKFNVLPKVGNVTSAQDALSRAALGAVDLAEALYGAFVEPATGFLKDDVANNPIVDLLAEAATHAGLRANLLVYVACVTNAAGDGLLDVNAASSKASVTLATSDFNAIDAARSRNAKVGPTVDKLIANCVAYFKQLTGDATKALKVEYALKNFAEQGPLSRLITHTLAMSEAHKKGMVNSRTKYSRLSDNLMIALTLQTAFDSARRYAYNKARPLLAAQVNSNFYGASTLQDASTASPQVLTLAPKVVGSGRVSAADTLLTAPARNSPIVASQFISKQPLKQSVVARLEREDDLTIRTVLAPLSAIRVLRDGLKDYVAFLQKSESVALINGVLETVGDRGLVELLSDRGQTLLLHDTIDNVLERLNNITLKRFFTTDIVDVSSLTRAVTQGDDLKIFDDSFVTSKTLNVLKAIFANAKFGLEAGSNVRVVAVGLPHGFSSKLRSKFKTSTFAEQTRSRRKQNDVIVVDVYKVDVRYPDLVFKPISKVFELSRFPVRNELAFRPIQVGAPLEVTLDAVPTRDYSHVDATQLSYGAEALDANVEYDFMSAADRATMARNHVASYALELYYRLLTGLPLSERELHVADPDDADRPAPFVVGAIVSNYVEKTFNVPVASDLKFDLTEKTFLSQGLVSARDPSTSRLGASTTQTFKTVATEVVDDKTIAGVSAVVSAATQLSNKRTAYTDPAYAGKLFMSPKLFERVFFVDVDPDDFEVDRDETFKSSIGRASFEQLAQAGEVVSVAEAGADGREAFRLKGNDVDKQMTFEKYFVTVRDYEPTPSRVP